MMASLIQRLLKPIVNVRQEEAATLLLMFAYSFLAMTSYNIVKPLATARFISDLGADNLPYVLLAAGIVIGVLMQAYSRAIAGLPRKLIIPVTQAGMVLLLAMFWVLFRAGQDWASVAVYFFRMVMGILLISQFWTLANDVYDPRQAKRLFGFIGGGASLGGLTASIVVARGAEYVGTNNLLLASGAILLLCSGIVWIVLGRTQASSLDALAVAGEEKGVGGREALRMLRESRHLQVIAVVIGFGSLAALLIETQLNLAAEATQGREATDRIAALLGTIQAYTSGLGFVIQIWLVSRIHRYLGIGFALLVLPFSLGATAVVILLNAAVWAPGLARVLDTSLRYTVDKTTREILFLPLPADLKYRAKPFVDVTVDRMARGVGGVLVLLLIKPWGLHLDWQQISWASLAMMGLWVWGAVAARRGYLAAFRQTLERRDVRAGDLRIESVDLSTIETLIEELSERDEDRVLYAIDVLESLDKRNLVTPLLLYHESGRVRARALTAMSAARPETVGRRVGHIEAMLTDPDPAVRAAAVRALAGIRGATVLEMARTAIDDPDPRLASTAAIALANSPDERDVELAEAVLARIVADAGDAGGDARRDVAAALGHVRNPGFHSLLVPLLHDPLPAVAAEAMRSVRALGPGTALFVPTLVALLGDRRHKGHAREALVGYGDAVLDALEHFLNDPDEDVWVRRHIPATLARIPSQRTMNILVAALESAPDGFFRFKILSSVERLHREHPELVFDPAPLEKLAFAESNRYFTHLSLFHNLFERQPHPKDSLLARALLDKMERSVNRIYLILGLVYSWRDMAAARWAIERGDARVRASAIEYLDNLLAPAFRKRILPILDDLPPGERVRLGNVLIRTRPRDTEETLLQLINDDDEVVAAAAIDFVRATRQWSLVADIEHVLAHRDVADWFVFEAASWALAEHRLPDDRRRTLWVEPLPAVEVADTLRRLAVFAHVSVDELFRIAGAGRQVRHDPGRVLLQPGSIPAAHDFLLAGRVELVDHSEAMAVDPPAPVAFEEALRGIAVRTAVRTTEPSVCLSVALDEFQTLLSDSPELVRGLVTMLLAHSAFAESRLVVRPVAPLTGSDLPAGPLKPLDRVLALRRLELFRRAPADEMWPLAGLLTEIAPAEGVRLIGEADRPACFILLEGQATMAGSDSEPALTAGPGDAIGLYETLAGTPVGRRVVIAQAGRALRLDHDDLFDCLSQRPGLLRHIFSALYGVRHDPESTPVRQTTPPVQGSAFTVQGS